MPKSGFKSVTIRTEVMDDAKVEYHKQKKELKEKGIFSFSSFVTVIIYNYLEAKK